MKRDDYATYAAQAPVMNAAWAFAEAYWIRRDMRKTWRRTHPQLRHRWAEAWLLSADGQLSAGQYDYETGKIVEAFVEDHVDHGLWESFARGQVKQASLAVDRGAWGVEANPEFVAPDLVLVRLVQVPSGGTGFSHGTHASIPLLMHYHVSCGWRLLNFLSAQIPIQVDLHRLMGPNS
jgi:hypothetical protein